jgi:hypothetical protein
MDELRYRGWRRGANNPVMLIPVATKPIRARPLNTGKIASSLKIFGSTDPAMLNIR